MIDPIGDRRTKVLVLIPTLDVGGAEMDVARNLPLVDRSRFEVIVCAFLARGPLTAPLTEAGIEVIGPLKAIERSGRLGLWLAKLRPRARWRAAMHAMARQRARLRRRLPWLPTLPKLPPLPRLSRPWRYLLASVPLPFLRPRIAAATAYVRMGARIAAVIRERKIDVVHAILPNAYLAGAIGCVLAGRPPLIMSRVSLNWYQKQSRVFSAVERKILHRTTDLVICNSAAISQDLVSEGVPHASIRVIPNGIDLAMFSPPGLQRGPARERLAIAPDVTVLSLVANFHAYKGHDDLLHALHRVRDRLPSGWLLLAPGRDVGGNLARTRRLCEQLGLGAHVRFLGELTNVASVLAAADIHVSASHTEGFPNNILEAMCAGLPVVATAVGGVAEMVIDGVTGVLVPARDPAAMGSALVALVDDPARRRALGEAGRARVVSYYAIERSVGALQESYALVAARPRPQRLAA